MVMLLSELLKAHLGNPFPARDSTFQMEKDRMIKQWILRRIKTVQMRGLKTTP